MDSIRGETEGLSGLRDLKRRTRRPVQLSSHPPTYTPAGAAAVVVLTRGACVLMKGRGDALHEQTDMERLSILEPTTQPN